jgi:hypothetical protein
MKIIRYLAFLAASTNFLAAPLAFAAPKELRLLPSSEWSVKYGNGFCRLARIFGEGDGRVFLFIERYSPSGTFRLTLSGKPAKVTGWDKEIKLQFGPSEAEQNVSFLIGELEQKTPSIITASEMRMAPPTEEEVKLIEAAQTSQDLIYYAINPISPEREAAVTYLSFGRPLKNRVVLETGSMVKPMAELSACVDEMATHWGVDVKRHAGLTRRVVPLTSPKEWVNSNDYPKNLLKKWEPGIVNFRLSIDDKGMPTACHIQQTLRERGFDDAVCKAVMKTARFKPALDADKLPIASYYLSAVRFQIPN